MVHFSKENKTNCPTTTARKLRNQPIIRMSQQVVPCAPDLQCHPVDPVSRETSEKVLSIHQAFHTKLTEVLLRYVNAQTPEEREAARSNYMAVLAQMERIPDLLPH